MDLKDRRQTERLGRVINKFPEIREMARKFNENGVKWAMAAGTAVYIYAGGDEDKLDDVDILIAKESKEKVAKVLGREWQQQSSGRHKAENITFGNLDIFTNCRKFREGKQLLDYQWTNLVDEHLRETAIDSVSYKIVAPEDVVVLKKPNPREKDKEDIERLVKDGLDQKYLQKRLSECKVLL